jgi:tetratricopeptide (TPR) repeat protein
MFSRSMSARDASELLEREIKRVADPSVRSKLSAQLAMLLTNGGQVTEAIERAESALSSSSGEARVQLLRALGLALTHAARPLAGLERAREGQRLHAELEPDLALPGLGMLLFSEIVAYAAAGNVEAARAAAARLRQEHPTTVPNWIATAIGRFELMAGRTEAARTALAPVIHDARYRRNGSTERWVLALHACTHLIEGRPERAEPELSRVRELEDGQRGLYHPEIDRAHAWYLAAQGNIDEAIVRLRAAAADCDERGAFGMVSALLHDVARFGDPSSVVRRLMEIADRSDGVLFVARALHAAGLANSEPTDIARALELFEEGGVGLYAAEAAAGLDDLLAAVGDDGESAAAHEHALALRVIDGVRLDTPAMS